MATKCNNYSCKYNNPKYSMKKIKRTHKDGKCGKQQKKQTTGTCLFGLEKRTKNCQKMK